MVYFFCSLFLLSLILINHMVQNKIYIKTPAMAIVMSIGILIHGVLHNFFGVSFIQSIFYKIFTLVNFALWITFFFSIVMSIYNKTFKILHYDDLINRFGIGTWIAATSISTVLLYLEFTQLAFWAETITLLNIVCWLAYLFICIRTFIKMYKTAEYIRANGILLLTTVSTQSIVILLNTVFHNVPRAYSMGLVILGLLFYCISLAFLIFRYVKHHWQIEIHWSNTNCILHGSLSITGVASVISHSIPFNMILYIWLTSATIFIIVEVIECIRLVKRLKLYGWRNGVFTYHISQWSRIFTFSMFYTFTFLYHSAVPFIKKIQEVIVFSGIWLVLFITLIQGILVTISLYQSKNVYKKNIELEG